MEGLAGVEERLRQHLAFVLPLQELFPPVTGQLYKCLKLSSNTPPSSSQPGLWGVQDCLQSAVKTWQWLAPPPQTLIQMWLGKEVCLVLIRIHTVSVGQILMGGAETIIWVPLFYHEFSLINLLHELWCLLTCNSVIAMHFCIVMCLHSNLNSTLKCFNYSKKKNLDFYNQPLEFLNRHKDSNFQKTIWRYMEALPNICTENEWENKWEMA